MQNELLEWAVRITEEINLVLSYAHVQETIAHALVAAERRGIERAAKVVAQRAEMRERLFDENGGIISASKSVEAEEIAAAIRQLGGEG